SDGLVRIGRPNPPRVASYTSLELRKLQPPVTRNTIARPALVVRFRLRSHERERFRDAASAPSFSACWTSRCPAPQPARATATDGAGTAAGTPRPGRAHARTAPPRLALRP